MPWIRMTSPMRSGNWWDWGEVDHRRFICGWHDYMGATCWFVHIRSTDVFWQGMPFFCRRSEVPVGGPPGGPVAGLRLLVDHVGEGECHHFLYLSRGDFQDPTVGEW
jgi:hypothetical protein